MRMGVEMSDGGGECCSNHNGVRKSAAELKLGLVFVNLICIFFVFFFADECVKVKRLRRNNRTF